MSSLLLPSLRTQFFREITISETHHDTGSRQAQRVVLLLFHVAWTKSLLQNNMSSPAASMTRELSSDSSALSNIDVDPGHGASSAAHSVTTLTPPTSLSENRSMRSSIGTDDVVGQSGSKASTRLRRQRSSTSTNNLKQLSSTQLTKSRGASGSTPRKILNETQVSPSRVQQSRSVKQRVQAAAGKVGSVLGKRSREAMEAGKRKLGLEKGAVNTKRSKLLRELDLGKKGVLDEIDLDQDVPPPPRPLKKLKIEKALVREAVKPMITGPLQKTSSGKKVKKWQSEGLYVGQEADNRVQIKTKRKAPSDQRGSSDAGKEANSTPLTPRRSFLSLPMFGYLDKRRDFVIPYDVFAPSLKKGDEKPKDWYKLNRNRLVGEAKDLWEKQDRLPASACVCNHPAPGQLGCEDDCLNRVMQYECNEDNCNLPPSACGNRAFAELQKRTKKGGSFDVGVEVLKTENRGFGVRSCRSFAPGQIIMEYTGEIISEGECQRRIREDYKDKKCYYLMELERNLVIDGTKGSMARFINHSCEPNCEVRMLKVNGTPRMAVFAGDSGITTGEELTYDYNFDNFGETQQPCYCGAASCRGHLSKRLNAAEQKKQAKEQMERKRKATLEMQKHMEEEERKKKIKTDRGSNWRGWVAVDDAEVKEQLKRDKKEREEAGKNSARAQRLAARRSSLPASRPAVTKREPVNRRKSATVSAVKKAKERPKPVETQKTVKKEVPSKLPTSDAKLVGNATTGSKFSEDLVRPDEATGSTSTSTLVQTTTTTTTTSVSHNTPQVGMPDKKNPPFDYYRNAFDEVPDPIFQVNFFQSAVEVLRQSMHGTRGKLVQTKLPFAKLT